ncbi:hypothetical protein [Nannocystis exedens]|uniref:hypothetical protein n=1 Tax=Nannocystis exedens TaxID=54 RepID=UPI000BBA0DBC|nr:hypothetical protein [Nannocystis exedens]
MAHIVQPGSKVWRELPRSAQVFARELNDTLQLAEAHMRDPLVPSVWLEALWQVVIKGLTQQSRGTTIEHVLLACRAVLADRRRYWGLPALPDPAY